MAQRAMIRLLRLGTAWIIFLLALYGLYTLFWGRGRGGGAEQKIETRALAPISRGDILSQFRLITVERQYRIPVLGRSFKPLPSAGEGGVWGQISRDIFAGRDSVPGTTTDLVYEMTTTVTVGIDLAKLKDEDIVNGDEVTTISLPQPEIIAIQHDQANSAIFAQNKPVLPYLDNSATLLAELQKTGLAKHRAEAEHDEALMAKAKSEARDSLTEFLNKIQPGRDIRIIFKPAPKP